MLLGFPAYPLRVLLFFEGALSGFNHLRTGVKGASFSCSPGKIGVCNRFHKNGFNLISTPSTSYFIQSKPSIKPEILIFDTRVLTTQNQAFYSIHVNVSTKKEVSETSRIAITERENTND